MFCRISNTLMLCLPKFVQTRNDNIFVASCVHFYFGLHLTEKHFKCRLNILFDRHLFEILLYCLERLDQTIKTNLSNSVNTTVIQSRKQFQLNYPYFKKNYSIVPIPITFWLVFPEFVSQLFLFSSIKSSFGSQITN